MKKKEKASKRGLDWWLRYSLYLGVSILWALSLRGQAVRTQWIVPDFSSPKSVSLLQSAKQWVHTQGDKPVYQQSSFRWQAPTQDVSGGAHLTATQYHRGWPVFDGFVRFHFRADGRLVRIQEHLLPLEDLPEQTHITPAQLGSRARAELRQRYPALDPQHWVSNHTETVIFHPAILRGRAKPRGYLAYSQHWEHTSGVACKLYWDTQNGQLLAYLRQHCELFHHQLYAGRSPRVVWESGESVPSDFDQWRRWQISATEQTYHLFRSAFGRDSYDGEGGHFLSRADAELFNCPNARWSGTSVQFCPGVASDDVVAHEWAHAYTQYTSNLTYAWQSGAINEAYSDIWGEVVDLLNDEGNDQGDHLSRSSCDDGVRWKLAEDVAVLDGPIRDLWTPNCHADPATSDDPYYDCDLDEADAGGVHSNSGIVNRTFALLVDGNDLHNGIGLTKAAHLFWHAQAHYLSRTADFRTLAAALTAAYEDLRGQELTELRVTDTLSRLSGERLSRADSISLQYVLAETGLAQPPNQCVNYAPLLSQTAPATCTDADYRERIFFHEDFEQGLTNWRLSAEPRFTTHWEERQWVIADFLPNGKSGRAAFAVVPNNDDFSPKQSGLIRLESPRIDLPPDGPETYQLRFQHYIALEPGDGARLTYRRNDTDWQAIPPDAFSYNAYQQILPRSRISSGNPLAGEWLFAGTDQGSNSGSWGTSIIDLSRVGMLNGDSLWLRWELGTDHSVGYEGWFVDDIVISGCELNNFLPVEWLSFTAVAGAHSVVLDWRTAAEYDNTGFFVERSLDGQHFYSQAWVAAASSQVYDWEDKAVAPGQWYHYRLRQVDVDGRTSYSPVRRVHFYREGKETLWVYPNPVREQLHLRSSLKEPIREVHLYSSAGTLVRHLRTNSLATTTLSMPIVGLPAGTYILSVELPTRRYQQLVMVWPQ